MSHDEPSRRRALRWAAGTAALLAIPALAVQRRAIARMTDGPFYPPRSWRERWSDWDADLTRVQHAAAGRVALGEHLGLEGRVIDVAERAIDGAVIEIWQCDSMGHYRHPNTEPTSDPVDEGFQGFGATRSDASGLFRFRTIKPAPYPGRTPHIHVKLRHASFGEVTSQLFVADDPGNARDFLWRSLSADDRIALEMRLQNATGDSGLRWLVRQELVVPA
ncbi:MAG TPA: intradiol ring-cleavage dioxygenase [Burkholderiaceae bacterium]|nr:intradiol ring-cleavage dioxygenase [Burkholderiaceae bacterium]